VYFEVLLTEKLKKQSVRDLLGVIEAIQSFDYDWEFYLVDVSSGASAERMERATPIPANRGAILFVHYLVDEDGLVEAIGASRTGAERIKRLAEQGRPLAEIVGERRLEELLEKRRDVVVLASVEAVLPLRSGEVSERVRDIAGSPPFDECEIVETEYYYLEPELVREALRDSYYLGEFLERLSEMYARERREGRGHLAILRGYFPADKTLSELEGETSSLIEPLGEGVLPRTLLFNRLLETLI